MINPALIYASTKSSVNMLKEKSECPNCKYVIATEKAKYLQIYRTEDLHVPYVLCPNCKMKIWVK
jgi:uncharacterized protein with PIN domain